MSGEDLGLVEGVEIAGPRVEGGASILTREALCFVAALVRAFRGRVGALLEAREAAQARFDAGQRPAFLEETRGVREGSWRVGPLPADLLDRRVEITGPVDRKMVINALNSGARVFMADCEDSNAPTWRNVVEGQINLRDAVRGTIELYDARQGKRYALGQRRATLMVRPRGWHLPERHLRVDGQQAPGGLVDFGLFFFHNAQALIDAGSGPYFYLPKLEGHLEARLWNDVFVMAQERLGVARGTIKATVMIETITAAFEMGEILYELREHSAGLNCGRWDYIFSFIKKFRNDPACVMPDRGAVGMTQPFMRAYARLLIKTCHRRGVHAMGGMAAQIPIKGDEAANAAALERVRVDKEREAAEGHDGTWVAHPGLVALAEGVFDARMPGLNQIDRLREDVEVGAEDLLAVPQGPRTMEGLRHNIRVGVQYCEAWLRGMGCVPLYHLMEDAATAEISRTQIWQWLRHGAALTDDDGQAVVLTGEILGRALEREVAGLREALGVERFDGGRFREAVELFKDLCINPQFIEFLTLPAYGLLTSPGLASSGGEGL